VVGVMKQGVSEYMSKPMDISVLIRRVWELIRESGLKQRNGAISQCLEGQRDVRACEPGGISLFIPDHMGMKEAMQMCEKEVLQYWLKKYEGNKQKVARKLKMYYATLFGKVKAYQLHQGVRDE
jgi:DNA-binding NtrC family response regulator